MRPYVTAAIIGISAIIAFAIIGHAYKYRSTSMETIVVTGLAETRKSADLKSAYSALKTDENAIRSYLLKKGINTNEMVFSSVTINKEFGPTLDANGRNLVKNLSVIVWYKL
jgi:hypothetical protein